MLEKQNSRRQFGRVCQPSVSLHCPNKLTALTGLSDLTFHTTIPIAHSGGNLSVSRVETWNLCSILMNVNLSCTAQSRLVDYSDTVFE